MLDRADECWAAMWPARPTLAVALLHSIHRDRGGAAAQALAPDQRVTRDDLRRFLEQMLRAGYRTVRPELAGDPAGGERQLLVTFDDGYFNNTWALDVLEEFDAPAIFFISTSHVLHGRSFWWDAVARRMRASGRSEREVAARIGGMKRTRTVEIERSLRGLFGPSVLHPLGDADRPLTPAELRDFAAHRCVTLGNHTSDHQILTVCDEAGMRASIAAGQRELLEMTGVRAWAIAYPNGDCSPAVMRAARAEGLTLGFTSRPHGNVLPVKERLSLGRHILPAGGQYEQLPSLMAPTFLPGCALRAALRAMA